MQINIGGPILVTPGEKITFTVTRVKDTPCKANWAFNGWAACGPETQPNGHTRVRVCTAPQTIGAKCDATVAVDFSKDDQGTYDPDEEYDVTVQGETGHSFTVPFSPPPVINGQTFHFQVSNP
jgi:hypothetical protein